MKKIVISGVNGFIGSSLCNKFLEMGYQVIGIGRSEDKHKNIIENNNYTFIKSDEIDLEIIKDADIFYHLAWNMSLYNTKDNMLACTTELENIKMSCEMMTNAIKAHVKRFIFAGSISEEMYYFDENRKLTAIKGRIYGMGKESANNIMQKQAYDANMEYIHVLLANTYGPHDFNFKAVCQFIKKMVNNEDLQLISESDQADWVYIDDTVNGLVAIGNKGINYKKYYLGHRQILTFGEYIILLKKVLESKSKLEFGVFQEQLGYDYSKVNLDELYNDTGFECQADFKESILKTKEWLEKEGFINEGNNSSRIRIFR